MLIFRNPFITEKSKKEAKMYLESSRMLLEAATKLDNKDPEQTLLILECLDRQDKLTKIAARKLGFLNVKDMLKYSKKT